MSLQIGMVARCLNTEHIRGMGKYVYEILRNGQRHPDLQWRLFGDDPRYGMVTPPGRDSACRPAAPFTAIRAPMLDAPKA